MIKYDVFVSPEADKDIDDIFNYIAQNLGAPMSAARITDDIYQRIFSLSVFPEGYAMAECSNLEGREIRKVTSHRYIIFYVVDKKNKTVSVLRVLYSRRNISAEMI